MAISLPSPPGDVTTAYIDRLTWKEDGEWVHGPGSNFFIEPDGTHVEGEFQGSKYRNPFKRKICVVRWSTEVGPGMAKKLGRSLTENELRPDWDAVRIDVMRHFVMQKFMDHAILAEWLLATGSQLIVEGNTWHDQFWGNCHCIKCYKSGRNHLGKILMDVRAELRG